MSEQGGGAEGGAGAQAETGAQGAEQQQHSQSAEYADNPNGKYLQAANVPAELAPLVMEALKHKDADVTRGFQEHKQFREQWEPYSKIDGLNNVPPEDLAQLVEWSRTMENPEAFQAWHQGVAEQLGLSPQLDEDSWVSMGEQNGWFEGGDPESQNGGEPGQFDPNQVQQMIQQALQQELEPVKKWQGQQEQQAAAAQTYSQWEGQLKGLAEQNHLKFDDIKDDVANLASGLLAQGEDPAGVMPKAFEHYMRMTGKAQGDLMEDKLGQPGGALNGGSADTRPEQASWNGGGPNPRDLAMNRFRQ